MSNNNITIILAMEFRVIEKVNGKVVVISIPKRLDLTISSDFMNLLDRLIEKGKFNWIIDLSGNRYIDSSGLGALVSRIAVCRSHEGDIRLAAPSEFVISLLEITHLNQILKFYSDVQTAVNSFQLSENSQTD